MTKSSTSTGWKTKAVLQTYVYSTHNRHSIDNGSRFSHGLKMINLSFWYYLWKTVQDIVATSVFTNNIKHDEKIEKSEHVSLSSDPFFQPPPIYILVHTIYIQLKIVQMVYIADKIVIQHQHRTLITLNSNIKFKIVS